MNVLSGAMALKIVERARGRAQIMEITGEKVTYIDICFGELLLNDGGRDSFGSSERRRGSSWLGD